MDLATRLEGGHGLSIHTSHCRAFKALGCTLSLVFAPRWNARVETVHEAARVCASSANFRPRCPPWGRWPTTKGRQFDPAHSVDDTTARTCASRTDGDTSSMRVATRNASAAGRAQVGVRGFIGTLARYGVSCMGAVYSQRRVRRGSHRHLLDAFREQEVDTGARVAM